MESQAAAASLQKRRQRPGCAQPVANWHLCPQPVTECPTWATSWSSCATASILRHRPRSCASLCNLVVIHGPSVLVDISKVRHSYRADILELTEPVLARRAAFTQCYDDCKQRSQRIPRFPCSLPFSFSTWSSTAPRKPRRPVWIYKQGPDAHAPVGSSVAPTRLRAATSRRTMPGSKCRLTIIILKITIRRCHVKDNAK